MCSLVDADGDGTLDEAELDKLYTMLDRGDVGKLSSIQDKGGAGAKRSLTWWNSAEETRRLSRQREAAEAKRLKAAHRREETAKAASQRTISHKLIAAMGLPVASTRAADADTSGAFESEDHGGAPLRPMRGRHTPGLVYREVPRFHSRAALMAFRRVERGPDGPIAALDGPDVAVPEDRLRDYLWRRERAGVLTEDEKQVACEVLSMPSASMALPAASKSLNVDPAVRAGLPPPAPRPVDEWAPHEAPLGLRSTSSHGSRPSTATSRDERWAMRLESARSRPASAASVRLPLARSPTVVPQSPLVRPNSAVTRTIFGPIAAAPR